MAHVEPVGYPAKAQPLVMEPEGYLDLGLAFVPENGGGVMPADGALAARELAIARIRWYIWHVTKCTSFEAHLLGLAA